MRRRSRGADATAGRHERLLRSVGAKGLLIEAHMQLAELHVAAGTSPPLAVPRTPPSPTHDASATVAWKRAAHASSASCLPAPETQLPRTRGYPRASLLARRIGAGYDEAHALLALARLRWIVRRADARTITIAPGDPHLRAHGRCAGTCRSATPPRDGRPRLLRPGTDLTQERTRGRPFGRPLVHRDSSRLSSTDTIWATRSISALHARRTAGRNRLLIRSCRCRARSPAAARAPQS